MALWKRYIWIIAAAVLFVSAGCSASDSPTPKPPTPQEIVAIIEKQAGPSDAMAGSLVGELPYQLPVPAGTKPVRIRGYEVYPIPQRDHAIVVRPMADNTWQTFMYLHGDKAPSDYAFKFALPHGTKLEKMSDGAISVVDTNNGNRVTMLKPPWALSVTSQRTPRTDLAIAGDVVTQTISLQDAEFPILADPEFEDPLTQIMEGRMPALKDAQTATQDGPKQDLFGYGVWYTGPNGLEIRFNNRGSLLGLVDFAALLGYLGVVGSGLKSTANSAGGNRILSTLAHLGASGALIAEIGHNHLEDLLNNEVLKNFCIGITIPKGQALDYFMRLMFGLFVPRSSDIKVWAEGCDISKPALLSAAAPPPVPKPEEKVEPIPPAPLPSPTQEPVPPPPVEPPPPPVAPEPASQLLDVSMTSVCRWQYSNAAANTPDRYRDAADSDSWYCVDDAGNELGGVSIDGWCQENYGATAHLAEPTAFGWKCKT